ncbi:MAG TPA: CcmD family protein [Saprospiraceae bacterium]|jgi:CcmD family protein|nr:CcmD family protein [Saprospiraceae bacterium]
MDDQNKIYVVIAVLSIILIGIALYMVALDNKIKKIEKKIEEDEK